MTPRELEDIRWSIARSSVDPSHTFDSYIPQNDTQLEIKAGLEGLCPRISDALYHDLRFQFDAPRIYVLQGGPGTGKTHLLHAVYQWKPDPGKNVQPFQLNGCASYSISFEVSLWEREYAKISRSLLLIDDLFHECRRREEIGNQMERFSRLVDYIYETRRVAIITTNYSFRNVIMRILEEYDPAGRVRSRLDNILTEFHIPGSDYRIKQSESHPKRDDPWAL